MNKIIFSDEARAKIMAGAEVVYKATSCTLGARGRNVVRQNFGRPKITNDGVTIAKAINLEDVFERQGADLLKEAAEKTVAQAGDGTTTSILLAYHILKYGMEAINEGNENPVLLARRIEKAGEIVLKKIKEMAVDVKDRATLEAIATLAVENPEYGKIIAEAVDLAGKDGQVTVEDGYKPGLTLTPIPGYWFARGWESPLLVTNPEKMEAVLQEKNGGSVPVLVADKSWNLIQDLLPLFNELKNSGIDKMLIIAEEISGELMQFINVNRMGLKFHAVVVKPPFNKDMIPDISAVVGGKPITNATGIVTPKKEHLGWAKKVIVTQNQTTIIGGEGNEEDLSNLIDALRTRASECEEPYEKEKLEERISKLTGKTMELTIGARTESEARYWKDKIDDSVAATRAAVAEGIVPGGGATLFRISEEVKEPVLRFALQEPLHKIMENCGDMMSGVEVAKALRENPKAVYDAVSMTILEGALENGIIDPAKVERCAVENAISTACMMLTLEAAIGELETKDVPVR